MTNEEIQDAIHTKAYSQITFIELQLKSLQKELPVGAYTQEMIDRAKARATQMGANTEVEDFVMDKAIEDILKYYPKDAEIDWVDNPKIEINTLQDIINRDNESK